MGEISSSLLSLLPCLRPLAWLGLDPSLGPTLGEDEAAGASFAPCTTKTRYNIIIDFREANTYNRNIYVVNLHTRVLYINAITI